jgi:hypothetical protein
MTIAYLTLDEVNAALGQELAARTGLALAILDIRQVAPFGSMRVLDLDSLPQDIKMQLLTRAQQGEDLSHVAAHSYHLTAKEIRLLRAAGVKIARRLRASLFATSALLQI